MSQKLAVEEELSEMYEEEEELLRVMSIIRDETLEQDKKDGFVGLARYQDFHKQSSKLPTKKHTIPQIDGACGFGSVSNILNHIGHKIRLIDYDCGVYLVE